MVTRGSEPMEVGEESGLRRSVLLSQAGNIARRADGTPVRIERTAGGHAIRIRELPVFTRSLAAMLSAGLPVTQALNATEEQVESHAFRAVLGRVRTAVQCGNSLSAAMSLFPDVFDEMYVSMLRTGEVSGRMAETLERLATHQERAAELRHAVRTALMYPAAVAMVAFVLTGAILVWIVPAFERIYADLGGTLPGPTLVLIGASRLLRDHALPTLAIALSVSLAVKLGRRTPWGAYAWARAELALPAFGALFLRLSLARFAEALSQMLSNGIPILRALDLAGRAVGNRVIERSVARLRDAVERGDTLSAAMKATGRYPALMVQFVATGERTGQMDSMVERAGKFYENEVAATLRGLTALVEPMLIVVLGLVVGSMVVCLFIPVFRLHELVRF